VCDFYLWHRDCDRLFFSIADVQASALEIFLIEPGARQS